MEKKTKILIISGSALVVIAALAITYFFFYAPNVKYKEAISVADNYFTDSIFEKAKSSYSNALEIKPKEEYPKQRIKEIDLQEKQKMIKIKYDKTIADADKLYDENKFEEAKKAYESAATLMKDEQYPKDKIKEINGILEQLKKKALLETYKYHIIVGAFIEKSNAIRMNKRMMDEGKSSRIIVINEGRMRAVSYSSHPNLQEAIKVLPKARKEVIDEAWVLYR